MPISQEAGVTSSARACSISSNRSNGSRPSKSSLRNQVLPVDRVPECGSGTGRGNFGSSRPLQRTGLVTDLRQPCIRGARCDRDDGTRLTSKLWSHRRRPVPMAEMDPGFRGCNPIPHIPPLRPSLVVPAKAGTQAFQSLASGSPLARGRRIVCPQDFLTASFAGTTRMGAVH
jgi:hypothetical protein